MLGLKVSNSCEEGKNNFDRENFATAFLFAFINKKQNKYEALQKIQQKIT